MTGYNMPPGVNVSDIPGNRPEDAVAEAFYDAFYTKIDEIRESSLKRSNFIGFDEVALEQLAGWFWDKVGEAYDTGYKTGGADERFAREHTERGSSENPAGDQAEGVLRSTGCLPEDSCQA